MSETYTKRGERVDCSMGGWYRLATEEEQSAAEVESVTYDNGAGVLALVPVADLPREVAEMLDVEGA
jgi:hypothetical protein